MSPKLLNAGPSERGWSFFADAVICGQKWAYNHPHVVDILSRIADGKPPVTEIVPPVPVPVDTPEPETEEDADPSVKSQALLKGSLIHIGLAHHYIRLQCTQQKTDPDVWYTVEDAMAEYARIEGIDDEMLKNGIIVLDNYRRKYNLEHTHFRVHAVEQQYEIDLNGIRVSARLDLVLIDKQNHKWIYDHKTAAYIKTGSVNKHILSGQMLIQRRVGEEHFGKSFGGMMINHIGSNPKNAQGAQFQRVTLPAAPHGSQFLESMIARADLLIKSNAKTPLDSWPKSMHSDICVGPYGMCPHFTKCQWGE